MLHLSLTSTRAKLDFNSSFLKFDHFTSGEIAANASRPNKDGYALAYSNPTLPGMSGGPVLNEQGELIGIHGRAERVERVQNSQLRNDIAVLKTEFNYAIPINTFLTLAPKVKKTLALRTPSPSVSSGPKADDFFLQAEEKNKTGDWKGAIADLDQAIRHELGDKQGAIADLQKAAALFKAQGNEKNYQAVLKTLQKINDR